MGHHHHHHHHNGNAEKNISIVFFLNLFFVFVEVIGCVITNSIAILSDAVHDLGDCLSLAVSWLMQKKSTKERDRNYSYGYKRYSLLGSIFLSGILCISSIYVFVQAVLRLFNPQEVNAQGMMWLAVMGVIINGAAALRVKHGESLNEKAVYLHIMEDVLGWVAVLVVGIVMQFWNVPILDPILSIMISVWVLRNVWHNTTDSMKVLMQAVPEEIDVDELKQSIETEAGVESTHDLHLWSLDGVSHVMTLHVVISDSETDKQTLRNRINEIAGHFNIVHTTIEFETDGFRCGMNCDHR